MRFCVQSVCSIDDSISYLLVSRHLRKGLREFESHRPDHLKNRRLRVGGFLRHEEPITIVSVLKH